jgi:predicted AlkP superfamily pyrophosphatase or phosphodiesterase
MRARITRILGILCLAGITLTCSLFAQQPGATPHPKLILLFVIDGLRPDSINEVDTPNLFRVRREGVEYLNSHSVFPTVTRVNAAAISTGSYPDRNGITSNTLYDPSMNEGKPFTTSSVDNLLRLAAARGGRLLAPKTVSELLTEHGLRFVAISSGSTGQAFLLNPEVQRGDGVLINGGFEGGKRAAYPDHVSRDILSRFGAEPTHEDQQALDWTERILREYVLTELRPDVVFDWLTEPDGAEHEHGVGSPEAQAALRQCDRSIGETFETLKTLELLASTDVIVTSDHGFIQETEGVAVREALVSAGLKKAPDSEDVVITSDGESVQFFVKHHDAGQIRKIVEFLQHQAWTDAVFVAPARATRRAGRTGAQAKEITPSPGGWLPGTFSLDLIHMAAGQHAPDIVLTLPWTSSKNAYGFSGRQSINAKQTGPIPASQAGHGGMGPWTVHTPLLAWGPDFKRSTTVRVPAANVDLAPTILALEGIAAPERMQGRPLVEALANGPDEEKIPSESRVFETSNGSGYRAVIEVSRVGKNSYVEKSWRIK